MVSCGHQRHIVFKSINQNVQKCRLFCKAFCRFRAISINAHLLSAVEQIFRFGGATAPQPRPHQTSQVVQLQLENESNWKSKLHFVSFTENATAVQYGGKEFGWTGVGWTPLLRTLTDAKADTQPEDTQW